MKKTISLLFSFLLFSLGLLFLAPNRIATCHVKNTYYYNNTAHGQGYDVDFLEETPLQVSEEKITYDIHRNKESSCKIEYTIVNPSEEDITTPVAFPFKCPISTYTSDEDLISSQYTLQADGKTLETKLNHFYLDGNKTTFDIPTFREDYLQDDVYTLDYPFYERCFQFTSPQYDSFTITLTLPEEIKLNEYCWIDFVDGSFFVEDGITYRTYTRSIRSGDMIWVIFLGKDDTSHFLNQLTFSSDSKEKVQLPITTSIINANSSDFTLQELMDSYFPERSNISKVDWYNATIQKLQECTYWNQGLDFFNLNQDILGCYQYSLTVPKNGKITHAIEGPAAVEITSSSFSYYYTFMFEFSDSKPYESIHQFSLSLRTDGTLYDTFNFSRRNLTFDENDEEYYALKSTTRPEGQIGFELYYQRDATSLAGVFAGIILMAALFLEIIFLSVFLFLLIFYLAAYFKDKSYYRGKAKQNLTLLLIEGLLSALSLPLLGCFIVASGSLLFPAILSLCLLVTTLIVDLIRHIMIKEKIYLPIILIVLSILLSFSAFIGVSIWGLAFIYSLIYSLYYFISFILARQKALREAN